MTRISSVEIAVTGVGELIPSRRRREPVTEISSTCARSSCAWIVPLASPQDRAAAIYTVPTEWLWRIALLIAVLMGVLLMLTDTTFLMITLSARGRKIFCYFFC